MGINVAYSPLNITDMQHFICINLFCNCLMHGLVIGLILIKRCSFLGEVLNFIICVVPIRYT